MIKKKILVTGCNGFIGYSLCKKLIQTNKYKVFGIDNNNNYYDVDLKKNRLKQLNLLNGFKFFKLDITNNKLNNFFKKNKFDYVIHLAAQAGVRYSIYNPSVYYHNNINGFYNVLDCCQKYKVKHFLFASTSSVYGDNKKFPLKENFLTDSPKSFYAATKKINEIMAYSYSSIYKLKTTGLRFFTVYGPYGRPDMSLYSFAKNIIKKKYINLYNYGNHYRDFTYIEDIVISIEKLIPKFPKKKVPFEIYNLCNGKSVSLLKYLKLIENYLKIESKKKFLTLQKGDVIKTLGDNSKLFKTINFKPKTNLKDGISLFLNWFKNYVN